MNRKKRLVVILAVLLLLAAVVLVAIMQAKGISPKDLFADREEREILTGGKTDELSYQNGDDGAFGFAGERLIVASQHSIRIYNFGGEEVFTQSTIMTRPAINICGEAAVVFDIGGKELDIIDENEQVKTLTAEGEIVSAALNENGWMALCAQESGYNGTVTVYNKTGKPVYKWYSGEGYVLGARVSPNNKKLAVLTVDGSGSKVSFFKLSSEDVQGTYEIAELGMEIVWLGSDRLALLSDSGVTYMTTQGEEKAKYIFEDPSLRNIDFREDGGFAAALSPFQVGTEGTLISVSKEGEELGSIDIREEVLDISVCEEYIGVLYSGRILVYTKDLQVWAEFNGTGTTQEIQVLSDGRVIAAGDFSSAIYSIE